jgi:hypothetical protein
MVRLLGQTRSVKLNSTAFIAVTGNALRASEDLVRRFLRSGLDPRCEDPEARPFKADFLGMIRRRRLELLCAILTLWRFGRVHDGELVRGRAWGSFEVWARWCRDPLLMLGCCDPALRIAEAKAQDSTRLQIAAFFAAWAKQYGQQPVKASELALEVAAHIDPQGRGRQYVAARLAALDGTRVGGFVLHRQKAVGQWGAATYALLPAGGGADGFANNASSATASSKTARPPPMPPMPPMPNGNRGARGLEESTMVDVLDASEHSDHRDHRGSSPESGTSIAGEMDEWAEKLF